LVFSPWAGFGRNQSPVRQTKINKKVLSIKCALHSSLHVLCPTLIQYAVLRMRTETRTLYINRLITVTLKSVGFV
jgi:hypothetical protein